MTAEHSELERMNRLLKEQNEKLKLINEATENGTWDWNIETNTLFMDSRFYSMGGYTSGEFSQSMIEWEKRIHPDDLDKIKNSIMSTTEGITDSFEEEYRFIKKTGNYIWIRSKGRVTEWNDNRKPLRFFAIHSDITEMKKFQLDLVQREKNFHSFFNTVSNIVFIYSPEGKIIYTNRTAEDILEYNHMELLTMEILDLYPWNLRPEAEFMINESLKQNRKSFSLPLVHVSGSKIEVNTQVYRGSWDGKESIYHISQDISEEKRLIKEMKQIKSAIEASSDGVLISDAGGNHLFHNMAMEQIFKYRKDEIENTKLTDLYNDKKEGKEVFRNLNKSGEFNSERIMKTKNGDIFAAHIRAAGIPDEKGKTRALSFTFTDISDLKESEKRLEKSEERLNIALTVSNHGVWEWLPQENRIFLDAHCYIMAGYTPYEFPSTIKELEKMVHPSDKSILKNIGAKLNLGTFSSTEEILRFKRKDRSFMWIQITGKKIVDDENPDIIRYIGTFTDLTDQKERSKRRNLLNTLQNRLLKPEALEVKLKDITDSIIPAVDADFARIWLLGEADLCKKGCKFYNTGYFQSKCLKIGKCLHLMVSSGSHTHIQGEHRRIPVGVNNIGSIFSGRYNNYMTNDPIADSRIENPKWFIKSGLVSFAGLKLEDSDGTNIGVLAVFSKKKLSPEIYSYLESLTGLTAQVINNSWNLSALQDSRLEALILAEEADHARKEAVEMNEQLSTVRMAVNSSSDGIAVSTISGEFYYINNTFTKLFDFSITELAVMPQEILFEEEKIFRNVVNSTMSGDGWFGQVEMLTKRGKTVPVFMRVIPFKDNNGQIIGLVWNFTDITEQKETEKRIQEYTRTIEKDLSEKESMLIKARLLQKNFIQTTLPTLEEFNIHALFMPCENLGGDFFNVIKGLHENKLVIIIGDCTDHGIKASMDASLLSSLVSQNLDILYTKNRTDHFLNKISVEFSKVADDDQFPTMFTAVIDLETRRMYYSNANSELPILKRGGETISLDRTKGMHIGFFDEPDYEMGFFDFINGDRLMFYSDALKEIEKEDHTRLGEKGLRSILIDEEPTPGMFFNNVINGIKNENGSLPLDDDTTFIQIDFAENIENIYKFNSLVIWKSHKNEIREKLKLLDYSIKDIEKIIIALDEMCINAFVHGNLEDASKSVQVRAKMNFQSVEFEITDQGKGFRPDLISNPAECIEELMSRGLEEEFTHGRGIWITSNFMDTVLYNKKGNSVVIRRNRGHKHVRFS